MSVILVVDDEPDLVMALEYALSRAGFTPRTAANGVEALIEANREPTPDLILLDRMLPDISGSEVFRRLRQERPTRHIPVVMVSAKGEELDRLVGLQLGADDYVTKPFSTRELLLRVRAILRRTEAPSEQASVLQLGRLRMDLPAYRCFVDQEEIPLTALEFRLLRVLLEHRGRVQTREALLDAVWGPENRVTPRSVDTHVKRLRQKLGAAGEYIETLRGVGYRLRDRA